MNPATDQLDTSPAALMIEQSIISQALSPNSGTEYNASYDESNAASALLKLKQSVTLSPPGSKHSDGSADSTTTESAAGQNITVQQLIHSMQPSNLLIEQSMQITTERTDADKTPAKTSQPPPAAADKPDLQAPNLPIPSDSPDLVPTCKPTTIAEHHQHQESKTGRQQASGLIQGPARQTDSRTTAH